MIKLLFNEIYVALPTVFTVFITAVVVCASLWFLSKWLEPKPPLVHLTRAGNAAQIAQNQVIFGPAGVFAVPAAVALLPPNLRSLVTFLPVVYTEAIVSIHPSCCAYFHRIRPVGIYTITKFMLSNYYCPYHYVFIGIAPDKRIDGRCRLRSWAWIYLPDILTWFGIGAYLLRR